MIEKISSYYLAVTNDKRLVHNPENHQEIGFLYLPLSRTNFLVGAGHAVGFLVHETAFTIHFLATNLFRFFQDWSNAVHSIRPQLFVHVGEIQKYLYAIPVGLMGALLPQIVNEQIFNIPASGYFCSMWDRLPEL